MPEHTHDLFAISAGPARLGKWPNGLRYLHRGLDRREAVTFFTIEKVIEDLVRMLVEDARDR